jgi:hypothetical protein
MVAGRVFDTEAAGVQTTFRGDAGTGKATVAMEARDRETEPEKVIADPLRMPATRTSLPSRHAAAQRRSMQAAMAAAVIALRSQQRRRVGWRPPPGGMV